MKKTEKYEYICLVTTIYSLLLYLLYADLQMIKRTLFVLSNNFPLRIVPDYIDTIYLDDIIKKHSKIWKWLNRHNLRWIYSPFIRRHIYANTSKHVRIFAQDHLFLSSVIIGWKKYTLIEDGKDVILKAETHPRYKSMYECRSHLFFPIYKILYGPTFMSPMARNKYCECILSSNNISLPQLKHIEIEVCNIPRKWLLMDDNQKKLIMGLFDLTANDVVFLKEFDAVLYTQNLYTYGYITKEEQIELYRKIVEKYPNYHLLIKPHPLDTLDYSTISNSHIWHKRIPSQLLSLCGVHFKRHITVFSTAINDLEEGAIIDWYGTEAHEKLFQSVGHIETPKNAHYCGLQL